jgi:hypothetical protein
MSTALSNFHFNKFFVMKFIFVLFFLPLLSSAQGNNASVSTSKAIAFINSLSADQKTKMVSPFNDPSRYLWHYVPGSMLGRTGYSLKDLNEVQKKLFYELLQVHLSEQGYAKAQDIMNYEYLLKELEPNNPHRIPENYFISVYGNPEKETSWGWKITGHHITLNFTIVKNEIAFAPLFWGIYPAEVKDGPKKGVRLLKEEEDLGFELIKALTPEQKIKAIFELQAFKDIVTTNAAEVNPLKQVGIAAKELTQTQQALLNKLISTYLITMPPIIAKKRIDKLIKEDASTMRFGWAGDTEYGKPHYYRVQGKTFLIEFDNTQNDANHIHAVWRDFYGDFGLDLIKEHYQSSIH